MSFSQEMKDFLGAYQSGQKINASRTDQDYKEQLTKTAKQTYDDNEDPESVTNQTAKAQLDKLKQGMSQSAQARADAHAAHLRSMQPQAPVASGLYPTGAINPGASGSQPTPGGALPLGPSTMQTGADEYAAGGLVPDEDADPNDADDLPPQNVGAVPINPINQDPRLPAPSPTMPTDVSARRRGLNGVISPDLIHDATKAGMTYGAKEYGLMNTGAVMTPAQQARARQFAQGHGAMTDEEMNAAKQAVDPKGELTDSQRNMAALGSVYQFWANKGDGEKASRVAFQMLQHYRNASQRYAAIAAHAAEGGNVDLATKAAMKAYANVPDGNDLELLPNPDGGIMYAVTGPNGDVTTKGIATPQQLAASAMGLATGGFDKAILSAAGQREEGKGAVKAGGKPQSAGDRAKEADTVGAEISKMKDQWVTKNKDTPVDEEHWTELGNAAQHIYQQNPKATASEVARAAQVLLVPGKDPEKKDFKVTPGEDGGPSTVNFGKLKVQLDDDQLDSILNSRAARVKAATDKIDSDMEAGDKPSRTDQAVEGAKQVGKGLNSYVTGGGPAGMLMHGAEAVGGAVGAALSSIYGQHIPKSVVDAVEATKGAIKTGADYAAEGVSGRMTNKGAIPIDEGDRPL
jgi:hypothetical protein